MSRKSDRSKIIKERDRLATFREQRIGLIQYSRDALLILERKKWNATGSEVLPIALRYMVAPLSNQT